MSRDGTPRAGAGRQQGEGSRRLRAGLRRHGLARQPTALMRLTRAHDLRFTDGNRIALFDTGRAGLEAMLDAIDAASERVHLETYILRDDEIGKRFLEALAGRARQGVAVRLLYDAVGSRGLHDSSLEELVSART